MEIISILNLVVLTATLVFIALQAKASNTNIEEIKKTVVLNSIVLDNQSTRNIYKILIEHPDLARKYGYDKTDAFNLMIVLHFESRYLQRKAHLISKDKWEADLQQMKKTMNRDFVVQSWKKDKNEFFPEFVGFVENEILEPKKDNDNTN